MASVGFPSQIKSSKYDVLMVSFLYTFTEAYKSKEQLFKIIPDPIINLIYNYAEEINMLNELTLLKDPVKHEHTRFLYGALSLNRIQTIKDDKLLSILSNPNTSILYMSLLDISRGIAGITNVGAILTEKCLYFVSALRFLLYEEFKYRSKIDEITDYDTEIDENTAEQIAYNLNICHDYEFTVNKITPYFVEETKRTILLKILFDKRSITSLPQLFELPGFPVHIDFDELPLIIKLYSAKMQPVSHVVIKSKDTLGKKFIRYIFNDIPFDIDEDNGWYKLKANHSYQSFYSIMLLLNERKRRFCDDFHIKHSTYTILPLFGQKHEYQYQCKVIYLREINIVKAMDFFRENESEHRKYHGEKSKGIFDCKGFSLGYKVKETNKIKEVMKCRLKSDKIQNEWITHLQNVMAQNDNGKAATWRWKDHFEVENKPAKLEYAYKMQILQKKGCANCKCVLL